MSKKISQNATGPVVLPADGVTKTEKYLATLCKRTFLSMWSYPSVFRDQGRPGGKGDGKEICGLLVVFENHIIIFSDKDCQFGKGNLTIERCRWFAPSSTLSITSAPVLVSKLVL